MSGSAAIALAVALALGATAQGARAQAVAVPILPAQPARYLLTTEVLDARGLWVNPAGMARTPEASIGIDATLDRFPLGGSRLSQYSATIASHGLAVGWVRNRYPSGPALDVYAIGMGLGDEVFSAGVTRKYLRGVLQGSVWDLATRISTATGAQLSLVARNVGSPRLNDSTFLGASFVPGASMSLLDSRLVVGGEWEMATRHWRSLEIRVGGGVQLVPGLSLLVRGDLAPDFKRRGFTVALSWTGTEARAGGFALLPGGASEVDAVGVSGALVGHPATSRR